MPSRRTSAAPRSKQRPQSAAVRLAHPPIESEEADRPDDRGERLLMVGIGASAGGLEAFTQLLTHLPLDTGMAFVLVQHLDPDHESALTQILSRATQLPVREVMHNQPVQANHVYIIPRDTNLTLVEGLLKLEARGRTRMPHRPIDSFFESLAQDQHERAIGVVLSGTATDGTLGLEAIKAEGGITFAQDGSAKYDSMPRSAVAAGCVDLVLAPADIAKELARIAKHPYVAGRPLELPTRAEKDHEQAIAHQDDGQPLPSGGSGTPPTGGKQARDEAEQGEKGPASGQEDGYKKIMLLLRNHSGVDFSLYKSSTIQRRIARRIVLTRQDTLQGYARFLRGNTEELNSLFSDVLISVTSFFRNPEVFDALQHNILPKLLAQPGNDPVRCWVLGCSTGQEAYSLAMSFVEAAQKAPHARKFQIFATDLNEKLLEKARHGLYAKTLAQDISPERLRQFFVEEDAGYRVSKALREMVVFARQNLIADPPFSRLDLISCRNLLIYLEPSLQQKAIPTFHYALKSHGYLLLGASESVGGFTSLFEPVDRKYKIFAKKPAPTHGFHMPVTNEQDKRAAQRPLPPLPIGTKGLPDGLEPLANFHGELNAQREADRIALSQFAPPAVLINDALQVLQFRGPTGAYLEPPAGKASFDVLKMAREGLMLPLRAAINKAKQKNTTVRTERVRVKRDGVTRTIHVAVIPLNNLRERCFLVVFEEAGKAGRAAALAPPRRQPATPPVNAQQDLRRIAELEADLAETREYRQALQEQHEVANEELQASNEEVQSANEELQSINEELETSKEELESTNEELTTVNEEMLNRNVALISLNNDLANFEGSAKLSIVVLGRDLTIRRFSPQAGKQLNLLASDIGQQIGRLRHVLVSDGPGESQRDLDLETLSAEVISELREQEREVRDKSGRWHLLRVRPYITLDNKVEGAVLVLVDIDRLKRDERAVRESEAQYRAMFESTSVGVCECDASTGRILRSNEQFGKILGYATADILGKTFLELSHPDDPPGGWDPYSSLVRGDIPCFEIEKRLIRKNGTSAWVHVTVNLVRDVAGHPLSTVAIVLDIAERKSQALRLQELQKEEQAIFDAAPAMIWYKDTENRVLRANKGAADSLGLPKEAIEGKTTAEFYPQEADRYYQDDRLVIESGLPRLGIIEPYRLPSGEARWIQTDKVPLKDRHGAVTGILVLAVDITERKRIEAALRESEERFRTLADNMSQFAWMADATGWLFWYNRRWYEYTGTTFEEMQGWGWEKVHHPDHLDRVVTKWRQAHITGEAWEDTFPLRGLDGTYRWFLSRALPIRDAEGQVVLWFGTNTDITELREAQISLHESKEQLEAFSSQLEQLVQARTEELVESQSRLRLMATELNLAEQRERKRLAGELHDSLAQWLVLCCLKLGQVRRAGLPAAAEEKIKETEEVLNQALDYSRTLIAELSPTILHEFGLPAALRWLGEQMQRHGLTVTVQIGIEDLPLQEDRAVLLFQSVRELLINTVKHAGSGVAWVSLGQQDGTLRIDVWDRGKGFDTTMKVAAAKFGLLSIRERMRALGGEFDLQSTQGEGTKATLVLPLGNTRVPSSESPKNPVNSRSGNAARSTQHSALHQQDTNRIRVLLVDDHAMVREGICSLLASYPDVEIAGEACNGEEAVAMAERLQPTIILMDINMPKRNGIDATAEITSRYPHIVVIGLSVQAGGANEKAMKKAGAARLLSKGAAVDELYEAIRDALK